MFGITGEPTTSDKGIQLASEVLSPGGIAKLGSKAISKGIPFAQKLASGFSELPLTQKMASKSLSKAEKLAEERGVEGIKIDNDVIRGISELFKLPSLGVKKMAANNLLHKAGTKGDYKSLFNLQSELAGISRNMYRSSSGADRLIGEEVGNLRQRLLDGMTNHLDQTEHADISELMKKGQDKYRKYKKISEHVYPPLKKFAYGAAGAAGVPLGYSGIKQLLNGDSYY